MTNIQKFIAANENYGFCEVLEYSEAVIISYTGYNNNLLRMGIVKKDNPSVCIMETSPRMHNTFRINCGAELSKYFTIETTNNFCPYSYMGEHNILLEASALEDAYDEE